jgi:hypothetical protein
VGDYDYFKRYVDRIHCAATGVHVKEFSTVVPGGAVRTDLPCCSNYPRPRFYSTDVTSGA